MGFDRKSRLESADLKSIDATDVIVYICYTERGSHYSSQSAGRATERSPASGFPAPPPAEKAAGRLFERGSVGLWLSVLSYGPSLGNSGVRRRQLWGLPEEGTSRVGGRAGRGEGVVVMLCCVICVVSEDL